METSYFEVLRISLAIGGPIAFIVSIVVGFMLLMNGTMNKLIPLIGILTVGPFSVTFAYVCGPLLVPEFPWLGFACTIGYGMMLNWLLCYLAHYSGHHLVNSIKQQVKNSHARQQPMPPLLLEHQPLRGIRHAPAGMPRAWLKTHVRRP